MTDQQPTTKMDRSDFNRATPAEQEAIRQRVQALADEDLARRQANAGGGVDTVAAPDRAFWRIAMAEYRLAHPVPLVNVDERNGAAECDCGWSTRTTSPSGLTTSVRAHRRYHAGQRITDRAHAAERPFTGH